VSVPGFAEQQLAELTLVVAEHRATAAGVFSGDTNAVLWSRQVVRDGGLCAVALDPRPEPAGPTGFQRVHAVAEQVAERLGVGAIDVAVLPGAALPPVVEEYAAGVVGALATDHAVVLTTDAGLPPADLAAALARALDSVPWAERSALILSGGTASATPPTVDRLADAIADLLDSLPTPATTHESTA